MEDIKSLSAKFLGPGFIGRRYLRYAELHALGIARTRPSLNLWISKGAFPAPLKIAGPYGKTLVWLVPEVVRLLASRAAARQQDIPETKRPPSTRMSARRLMEMS